MTENRDHVVAEALRGLPVPDHGPGFWEDLQARVAAEPRPARVPAGDPAPSLDDADDAQVLPLAVPIAGRTRRASRPATWLVSVAAALVLVVAAAAVLVARQPEAERVRVADRSDGETATSPSTTAVVPDRSTTIPAPAGPRTADAAVVAWLDAVGAGDIERAAALTGPRSKAYADALTGGAGVEGFLVEAGEGFGAWADSPDRSTTEVDLEVDGEEIVIVVVSGTWRGEGGAGFRTDAIPAVRSADGSWSVEPWAIDPATGSRLEVLEPTAAAEAGFNGLAPDAALSARAPGDGTFHFSLDDQPPTRVPGRPASRRGAVEASFDPPGEMSSRTHLFVIAYVDGDTISAVAGTFLVEG